jgi:phosphoglycolate phosphatase
MVYNAQMAERLPFDLLIFDWDGTLMDSIGSIVACMQTTVEHVGLPPIPAGRIRDAVGLGLRETLDLLVPGTGEETRGKILEGYRRFWFSTYRSRPVAFEGVADQLRGLGEDGYLLAVATGKGRHGLDRDLEATGLTDLFHCSRTADETFSKPHPRMVEEILDDLGVRADRALMVGDTTYDLEMAANAGVPSLAVLTGSHRRQDLLGREPLGCIDSVCGLRNWLAATAAGRVPACAG